MQPEIQPRVIEVILPELKVLQGCMFHHLNKLAGVRVKRPVWCDAGPASGGGRWVNG